MKFLGKSENYKGCYFSWIEEWSQFFEPCNWRTFHPLTIELEDDRVMGGVEVTIVVLGLGFTLRVNYAETERLNDIRSAMVEIGVIEDSRP